MGKTALIVGAGPAGLTAAYQLLKESDIKPIIIEKESFVGGISCTINHNGNRIDIGGHRFFSKNSDVVKLWQEILPVQGENSIDDIILGNIKNLSYGGPNPEEDDNVLLIRSRISRILYFRKFFDYPISLKLQTLINLGLFKTIKAGIGYLKSQVYKREEKTLEDFMINRFGDALYEMFFEEYTYKVWGRTPSEISSEWGAQRIKGLSLSKAIVFMLVKPFFNKGINNNIETSLIEQYYYPKYGPGQLWQAMSEKIVQAGGEIYLNSEVLKINTNGSYIDSVVYKSHTNIKEIKADYFISSMPISELVKSLNCNVTETVKEIAINLPYRDFITVGLLIDKLSIKNTSKIKTVGDIIPDCWIYVQEPDVRIGRLQIFNNWSPYMVKDFKNTVWIGMEYFCQKGDDMWNMSDEEFISFAISEVVKIGFIDNNNIIDSVRIKVEKAYPAYFGTYANFNIVKDYLNNFSNLYCVGRNGQHRYNNMDHSMLTSIEAVELIKTGKKDKSIIWNVNAEKEYHEDK